MVMDSETEFTAGEKNTVSTDDANCHVAAPGGSKIAAHRIRFKIAEGEGSVTDLTLTAKGYGESHSMHDGPPPWDWYGYDLYIWNHDTVAWELLDTHAGTSKATVSGSKSADCEDYIDGSGYVYALVCSPRDGLLISICRTYFIKLDVTGAAVYEEDVGSTVLAAAGATDLQTYTEAVATTVTTVTGGTDTWKAAEYDGTTVDVVTGGTDLALGPEHHGQAVRVIVGHLEHMTYPAEDVGSVVLVVTALGATEVQTYADHLGVIALVVTAGTDAHINEKQGTVVSVTTGEADLQTFDEHRGTRPLVLTGATVGYTMAEGVGVVVLAVTALEGERQLYPEHGGTVVLALIAGTDSQLQVEHLGTVVLAATGATDLATYLEHLGLVVEALTDVLDLHTVPILMSAPAAQPDMRQLSWPDRGQEAFVIVDGEIHQRTTEPSILMPGDLDIRQVLKVALGAGDLTTETLRQWGYSPLDRVELAWSESSGAAHYRIDRRTDAGAWEQIAGGVRALSYVDGPLRDGTHSYRVWAVDAEGDVALSNARTLHVASAPEPPSGVDWTWDPETQTLKVSWQESPSSDVASYRVRSSGGGSALELANSPVQDGADLSWQKIFSGETDLWIVLVRAVDGSGSGEANLEQALAIPFEGGQPASRPAEPRLVEVEAIEDGKIEVRWLYDPHFELLGPGAGQEARIYWDAGTGTIDLSAPLATVAMSGPTSATRYSWQSGPPNPRPDLPLRRACSNHSTSSRPGNPKHRLPPRHRRTTVLSARII